jgi:signal peptidase II
MNSKRWVFVPMAIAVALLDQLAKLHAIRTLDVGARTPLVGDVLALTHLPAAGGAFGILRDATPTTQLIGFAVLSLVSTIVIVLFYRGLAPGEHGSAAALGAILGGIASNFLDRIRYGTGIDFLHLGSADTDAILAFNLADVAIVLGVVTLIVELLATEMAARASERPRS